MTVANHDGASKRWRARLRVAARAAGRTRTVAAALPPADLFEPNALLADPQAGALARTEAGTAATLAGANRSGTALIDAASTVAFDDVALETRTEDSVTDIATDRATDPATDSDESARLSVMASHLRDPAIHGTPVDTSVAIEHGWTVLGTDAGAFATPADLPAALHGTSDWIAAKVPGTVAQALRDSGRWAGDAPRAEDNPDTRDWWYRTEFEGSGVRMLRCEGLATIAEVWVDGALRLQSRNMFATHEIELDLGDDPAQRHTLHLVFRAMQAPTLRRQRWRQKLISQAALRGVRSAALGRMPGWCAPVPAVGPWRRIALVDLREQWISHVDIETRVIDGDGIVNLRVEIRAPRLARQACAGGKRQDGGAFVSMMCGEERGAMHRVDSNVFEGEIRMPSVRLWWPHTHGETMLHDLSVEIGGGRFDLGRVGFRTVEADHGTDGAGFALVVNGVRVFCRGACWTAADLVALPATREAYEPWLRAARDANMNMIRIAGVMTYEANPFFELCDELGILVWQDMMFANFDYPADDLAFSEDVSAEVEQLLLRTQANPSLAVICGGSEVAQQAAMFGVESRSALPEFFTDRLPSLVARYRPDLVYVPNSPSGGELPFQPDTSVAHYYGVGAYKRGFDDIRRSNVRFASECLALSNVPAEESLAVLMPEVVPGSEDWKRGVPRDNGADWDFEETRDHYVSTLYGLDPVALRETDPRRYLDAGRAVSVDLVTEVFSEWRRHGASCAGGLVWQLQDLRPGAGWGVIGVDGRPKAAWYAMRAVFKPVQLLITDEGLNGLHLHIVNDRPTPLRARLELASLRNGETPLLQAGIDVDVEPHSSKRINASAVVGRFFDFTYAYRFGPREHDVTIATLHDRLVPHVLDTAFHLPERTLGEPVDTGLTARVERDVTDHGWVLVLSATRFARMVQIVDPHYIAEDNFFSLAPARERRVRLTSKDASAGAPSGTVRALNGAQELVYRGR
ncbi:beta-mannosidase [Pararobbsia alpina]|uniref:glycoside hydrolase family 2 protein n=1 Tax=Pararobbsia alpina TaxID=621374 RepID=UPI0039A61551